jgi:hypothetical protein
MCNDEFDLLLVLSQFRAHTAQAAVDAAPGNLEAALELRCANVELAGLIESRTRVP